MTTITRFKVGKLEYAFEGVQDWNDNFGDLVPRTRRLPGMDGGFDEFGDGPAPAEIGKVQINFIPIVDVRSDMTAKLDALRAIARQGKGRLFMQPADESAQERFCFARLNNISTPHSEKKHTDLWMRAKATFQVDDPHWYTQGTEAWAWGDGTLWGTQPWGGSATPQAVSGLQTDFQITRVGNAPTRARITIACGVGQSAQDIRIQRLADGLVADEVRYNDALIAGDSLEINARESSVTLNGADAYSTDFTFLYPDWFRLLPGVNDIRVLLEGSGNAATVTIRYYEAYV